MRARRIRLAVAVLFIVLIVGLAVWAAIGGGPALPGFELSVSAVEDLILSWGAWGVLASILIMIVHSFVPFPAEVVAMANGMLYGPVWGTAITWVGAMLGAWLAFGLARWLGRPFVESVVASRHHRALDRFAAYEGGGVLLFSRFVPVISFNLINYAAGLTAVSWWTFTWATGLGILPLTCLMTLAGHHMWSGHTDIWPWLLLGGAGSWLAWRWLARSRQPRSRTAADLNHGRPASADGAGCSGGARAIPDETDPPQRATRSLSSGKNCSSS